MTVAVAYKIGHTTRIPVTATLNNGPLLLALTDIQVILQAGSNVVTLGIGSGVGLDASDGTFHYDVTVANLISLGNPTQVLTTINIWYADNTLAITGSGLIDVML